MYNADQQRATAKNSTQVGVIVGCPICPSKRQTVVYFVEKIKGSDGCLERNTNLYGFSTYGHMDVLELRAEIGKFPNSTNERKQMSNKTMKQRIALVAASALTAGFLSVVSAPAAFAVAGDITQGAGATEVITAFADTSAGVSGVATIDSSGVFGFDVVLVTGAVNHVTITGGTITSAGTGTGSAVAAGGLTMTSGSGEAITNAIATPSGDLPKMTLTVRTATGAGATLYVATIHLRGILGAFTGTTYCSATTAALATAALTDNVRYITVPAGSYTVVAPSDAVQDIALSGTGGIVIESQYGFTTTAEASVANNRVTLTAANNEATVSVYNTGVGSYTLKTYNDANDSSAADTVSVTVVAQCSTGTYSAGDSFVEVQSTSANADDNVDDVSSVADTAQIFLAVQANDVYGNDVPLGTWVASATNGALVGIGTSTAPACGATSVASAPAAGTNIHVGVCQGTDNKAQSTVLTLTYGTTEVAKKSLLITGDVAKLEVSSVGSPKNTGAAQYKVFKTRTFDAAGNQIAWADALITADAATLNQDVIALDGGLTSATDYVDNVNQATCAASSKGKAAVRLKALTNTLTYVYSDVFTLQCAGTTYTYTASLDKASYVPGDIATLTISAKDVNGLPVHTLGYTANDGSTGATRNLLGGTTLHTIVGSQMDVVTAPAATDRFGSGGVKTYQLKVGSTEGDYAMSVSLPDFASTSPAVTIKYSVKSSTTAVSNADVLKSIVALIASINKQIQALQKLILKR